MRKENQALVDTKGRTYSPDDEAWVLADNDGAEAFYAKCGFVYDQVQPSQMTLRL